MVIHDDKDMIWNKFNWRMYLYYDINADPKKMDVWCDVVKSFPYFELVLKMKRISIYDLWIIDAMTLAGMYNIECLFGFKYAYEVGDLC